jgi:hypothetical protein
MNCLFIALIFLGALVFSLLEGWLALRALQDGRVQDAYGLGPFAMLGVIMIVSGIILWKSIHVP